MQTNRPNTVFMGSPDFAVPTLKALVEAGYPVSAVVTQPDKPKGRSQTLTPPPVKVAAEELNIEGADLSDARWYVIDDRRLLSWSPEVKKIENGSEEDSFFII